MGKTGRKFAKQRKIPACFYVVERNAVCYNTH